MKITKDVLERVHNDMANNYRRAATLRRAAAENLIRVRDRRQLFVKMGLDTDIFMADVRNAENDYLITTGMFAKAEQSITQYFA